MVMIFENLKKSWCICKCCMVVYLPTNFEKDWPTLIPDCFAWFSHRRALKYITAIRHLLQGIPSYICKQNIHTKMLKKTVLLENTKHWQQLFVLFAIILMTHPPPFFPLPLTGDSLYNIHTKMLKTVLLENTKHWKQLIVLFAIILIKYKTNEKHTWWYRSCGCCWILTRCHCCSWWRWGYFCLAIFQCFLMK